MLCVHVQPWYASVALEPVVDGNSIADHGQGVALPAGTDMVVLDSDLKRLKHEHKHKSKKGHKSKKSGKSDAKSVAELRAERQAREQKERQLQRKLLQAHHNVR